MEKLFLITSCLRTVLIVGFCVLVLLLVILNGASKSYTISWLYKILSSRVLSDSRDLAVTTVSGRLFHGSVIRIGNKNILRFSLALCVNNFRECPLFPASVYALYASQNYTSLQDFKSLLLKSDVSLSCSCNVCAKVIN